MDAEMSQEVRFSIETLFARAHPRSAFLSLSTPKVRCKVCSKVCSILFAGHQRSAAVALSRLHAFPMLSSALDHGKWSGSIGRSYLRTADVLTRERSRRILGRGDLPVILGVDGRHEGGCSDELKIFPSRRALFATGGRDNLTLLAPVRTPGPTVGINAVSRRQLPQVRGMIQDSGPSSLSNSLSSHMILSLFFSPLTLTESFAGLRRTPQKCRPERSTHNSDSERVSLATTQVPAHSSTELTVLGLLQQNIQPPLERVR